MLFGMFSRRRFPSFLHYDDYSSAIKNGQLKHRVDSQISSSTVWSLFTASTHFAASEIVWPAANKEVDQKQKRAHEQGNV